MEVINLDDDTSARNTYRTKRKCMSMIEKVMIIRDLENGGKKAEVSKKYNLPPSTVSSMWKNKEDILYALDKRLYNKKRLRKPYFGNIDEALVEWVNEQHRTGVPIGGRILRMKAEQFAKQFGYSNFRCSNGWIDRFKNRNNIVYKKGKGGTAWTNWMETAVFSGEATLNMKEREAAIKAGLIPPDDASSSESSPDPQPGTSQDPPLETSLKDKPATFTKTASRAVKEQLSEHEQPGSWNTNEVFVKQEVDLSDGILEDDNSIGNSSIGESEFSQIRQPDLSKEAGNRHGSTELSQQRLPKKRKAALEHAYIRPHLPVTARQEERSSVVESQSERVWNTVSTESAEQSKRKNQETPYRTQRESITHQKEELEAVLLRLQVKKLLLEMEKISEERERIAVEKSNITLRYKCLELREKLNDSILSGTAAERLGCASSLVPSIIVDSSSAAHSKCSTSAVGPGSKSSAAAKKSHASSPVKSRKSSTLSGKDNISTPETSNKSSESDICKISADDTLSSKAVVQHTSEAEAIQDTTPPKCISSVAGGRTMKVKVPGQDKVPVKQTQKKQTTSKAQIEVSNLTHSKSKVQPVPSNTNRSSVSVPSVTSCPVSPLLESHSVSLPPQISETAKTTFSGSVNKCLLSHTQQPNQESCVKDDEPVMTKLDTSGEMTVSLSPSQTSDMAEGLTTCSGDRRNISNAKKYLVSSSEQPGLKVSVEEPVDDKLDIAEEMSEPSHSQSIHVSTFKEDGELLSDDNDQLAKKRKLS